MWKEFDTIFSIIYNKDVIRDLFITCGKLIKIANISHAELRGKLKSI